MAIANDRLGSFKKWGLSADDGSARQQGQRSELSSMKGITSLKLACWVSRVPAVPVRNA